jgi:hypothetical protein
MITSHLLRLGINALYTLEMGGAVAPSITLIPVA